MSWLISVTAFLLYFKRKNVFKFLRKRYISYRKNKKLNKDSTFIEQYERIDHLKENIGEIVTIRSKDLTHLYHNQIKEADYELTGKILELDDDWIKLEYIQPVFTQNRDPDYLYFRTDAIVDFSVNKGSKLSIKDQEKGK